MITDAQLQQIMPTLTPAKRQLYLPHLNAAMQAQGIDTLLRITAFVAQLAHESGEFRWMEELWGPTPAQRRYEPPSDLARRLGNTQPGDGARFKGRGPIQITGRFNYAKFGKLLGIDLTAEPAQAATPPIAFATAGLFWSANGLNALADERQFVAITRRINGGTNGLAERQRYYERAQAVLGVAAGGAARGAPLQRGFEAIVAAAATTTTTKKKPAAKQPAGAKKAMAKKSALKKSALKKAALKKAALKKAASKKPAAKKSAAKKPAAKRAVAKKPGATRAVAKKAAPVARNKKA